MTVVANIGRYPHEAREVSRRGGEQRCELGEWLYVCTEGIGAPNVIEIYERIMFAGIKAAWRIGRKVAVTWN